MNCDTFQPLISREIDGQILPEEEATLMHHVATCDACREEREAQRQIHATLRDLPRVTAPAGLADRIADRVLAAPVPLAFSQRWMPALRAAAILLMTASLAFFAGRQTVSPGIEARQLREVNALAAFQRQLADQERVLVEKVGISPEDARRVRDIRLRYKMKALFDQEIPAKEVLWDQEAAEILQALPAAKRAGYWKLLGGSEADLARLLTLPLGR